MNDEQVTGCVSLGESLAAREGLPSAAEACGVLEHVRNCTTCRRDLEDVEKVIAVLRQEVADRNAARLAHGRDRLRAELEAPERTWRPWPGLFTWPDLIKMAAAIPLVILGVLVIQDRRTSAGTLVDCAAAAERSHPPKPGRPPHARLTPSFEAAAFKSWNGTVDDAVELPTAVVRLLDRYGHRGELLRAKSYRDWQGTLSQPRDLVIEQGDLRIVRTFAPSADVLRAAELIVRADTCEVVGVTLLGPDYRVEVTR